MPSFWKKQPLTFHGVWAEKTGSSAFCAGVQPTKQTLPSFPLQPSLLSVSIYFVFLFICLYILLPPSLPVKFHSPFIPGKTELEGFENHFKRQPSPIVFPMAYGDNNGAAAPDLLASITLQDQLIPVKITYVTEE